MKKIYVLFFAIVLALTGCEKSEKNSTNATGVAPIEEIKVGATPVPHAEILEFIKPMMKEQGFDLKIQVFSDYVIPNKATEDGEIDANFFQHEPYLDEFNKNRGTHLLKTVSVHIEPMGIYSKKVKSLDNLKNGASVSIPNDPSNGGRALEVLQDAGLIKLGSNNSIKTVLDISENFKNLKITALEAPQLPRTIDDFDISVINTNYALPAGFNPLNDALAIESKDSPYANILVVKAGNENKTKIEVLNRVLTSKEVREFILEKYQGAILPTF